MARRDRSHLIFELEDGRMTVTRAVLGRRPEITDCRATPLADFDSASVALALDELLDGLPGRGDGDEPLVHVLFSDRRFHHFHVDLPRLKRGAWRAVVEREIRRRGGLGPDESLLFSARKIARVDGRDRWAIVALPEPAWDRLRAGFVRAGLTVHSATSIEDAAAQSVPSTSSSPTIVLEPAGGRIRLSYCQEAAVLQTRRIMLPSGPDALSTTAIEVLAAEVPRTIEFLREHGLGAPTRAYLSHRFGSGVEASSAVEETLETAVFRPALPLPVEAERIGMGTLGYVAALLRRREPSLLASPDPVGQRSATASAVLAAAAVLPIVGLSAGAWALRSVNDRLTAERDRLVAEQSELVGREDELTEASAAVARSSVVASEQLTDALGWRRPYGRLVAEIAATVPDGVTLGALDVDTNGKIVLDGVATGDGRQDALQRIASFVGGLRTLEFVEPGREQFFEGSFDADRTAFRVETTWRRR